MAKLDEELVAAFIVEKFNVTQSEAWEFIDSIKAQAKVESDAEAAEKAERKKKQYVIAISDPKNKLGDSLKNYTGYILEKLEVNDVEWGDLELPNKLDDSIAEIKKKYSKKGPFNIMDDILCQPPNKYWKEKGIKLVSKNPIALIPVTLKNLKAEIAEELEASGFLH